jgi:hypothetical protein
MLAMLVAEMVVVIGVVVLVDGRCESIETAMARKIKERREKKEGR